MTEHHRFEIIDKIESVRARNNANWMDILRVAYRHAPRETAEIMKRIHAQDSEISDLVEQLGK